MRRIWRAALPVALVIALLAGCPMEPPPYDDDYENGGDAGNDDDDGGFQGIGTCTRENIENYESGDRMPGWTGHRDTTIQVTSYCGSACSGAFTYGPSSHEVQTYCSLLFATHEQFVGAPVPPNACPVCEPFRS